MWDLIPRGMYENVPGNGISIPILPCLGQGAQTLSLALFLDVTGPILSPQGLAVASHMKMAAESSIQHELLNKRMWVLFLNLYHRQAVDCRQDQYKEPRHDP